MAILEVIGYPKVETVKLSLFVVTAESLEAMAFERRIVEFRFAMCWLLDQAIQLTQPDPYYHHIAIDLGVERLLEA